MTQSHAPDIETRPHEQTPLDFHPKVAAYLRRMLSQSKSKLETTNTAELAFHQASVKIIRIVLGVPKTIRDIEAKRRRDGQPVNQPEDYDTNAKDQPDH